MLLREQMLAPLHACQRCTVMREQRGDDVMEEIVFHVLGVIQQRAVHRWFHTWNRELKSTPIFALEQGRTRSVLDVTRRYEDPGFG